ncbi:hypothetical protein EJ08DRAFT_698246 [Tothia fuscella]|uniref:Uncharacterized protein n=1 Tax=Tothia fuscella TaxID=1048955 RepID=A0A9P4NQD5_9PEZI|nr:hypothetical protein EJ08DRAFT_698246 [Tothia fuscella]
MQFSLSFSLLALATTVLGQLTPFSIDGALDDAIADPSCTGINCGGTMSVNGYTVIIPKNSLIAFPATFVPFKALADQIFNYRGLEVIIDGNMKGTQHIAGLVSISQFQLEAGMGRIASVNNDGRITIVNGPTIRINDPNAVYSVGYNLDPFFTADDENPSITAFSGFPMCVPRSATDALCPSSNRPLTAGAPQTSFQAPDPLVMAPFLPGDFLSWSGRKVGNEIICYAIVAENIQITTTGIPTYIRMEDAIIGVYNPDLIGAVEFADTRFIGMLSDSTASVSMFALDVDPCSGTETERLIGNAVPRVGDARNKFIWRADSTTLSKYTREYIVKVNSGQKETKNGIQAGQYVQPVTEWIQPEANIPGQELPPLSFGQFTHLTLGAGKYVEGDETIFGALDPFPGATQPPPSACSATPPSLTETPVANAGIDQTLIAGSLVQLSATNSNNELTDLNLNFAWTFVSSVPTRVLTGANAIKNPYAAKASFVAPQSNTVYQFDVKICVKDDAGAPTTQCATDRVHITIQTKVSNANIKDVVTVDTYSWQSSQSGTISVACHSSVVDGTVTSMRLTGNTLPGGSVTMTAVGSTPGAFTYQSRSIKLPTSVTCTSNLGGAGTRTTTTQ